MVDFEFSSVNLAGLAKALDASGRRKEIDALLSPEARAALADPHSARWHAGKLAVEMWTTVIQLGGPTWLEDLNYEMTKKSFGPIVGSVVKIGLTLSGSSPASVFSRLDSLVSVALKGLQFEWKAGAQGGAETITYPCPMPKEAVEAGWRGIIRVGGEMTGKTIRIDRFVPESDRRFRLEVSW